MNWPVVGLCVPPAMPSVELGTEKRTESADCRKGACGLGFQSNLGLLMEPPAIPKVESEDRTEV